MVKVTERAAEMMKLALEQEGMAGHGLRLIAQGGGGCSCCGGTSYGLIPEREEHPSDTVITESEVRVFIDPSSLELLEGATIDFVEHPEHGQGFTVQNPNDQSNGGGCGCQDEAHGEGHECGCDGDCDCNC